MNSHPDVLSITAASRLAGVELLLFGFPAAQHQSDAVRDALRRMSAAGAKFLSVEESADRKPEPSLPWLEKLYRLIDARLFAAPDEATKPAQHTSVSHAKPAPGPCLTLAYDEGAARRALAAGHPVVLWPHSGGACAWDLTEATRAALGCERGTLPFTWMRLSAGSGSEPLFHAELRIEHRSLSRSLRYVQAKWPELLQAAWVRAADAEPAAASPLATPASVRLAQGPLRRLLDLLDTVARRLLLREQWCIGLTQAALASPHSPGSPMRTLVPPRGRLWADPFVWAHAGGMQLFFEDMPFESERGKICMMELDQELRPRSPAKPVISEPYHVSYPFLWSESGRRFAMPESSANRSVDLYEWLEGERSFKKLKTLIQGMRLADASLVRYEDRLWMFATGGSAGAVLDAERIEGPWTAHRGNPVKIDATNTRPAGGLWVADGRVHRVVQDCSRLYGGSTRCMRIERLDGQGFAETEVTDWAPGHALRGLRWHTLNEADGVSAIDWLRMVRR
jgi:hypothetical protein